jgi:acetyl-CoA synthetase
MEGHTMQLSAPEAVQVQVRTWLKEYGRPEVAIVHLLCDRHAQAPDTVALVYEDAAGREARYTFSELRDLSAKWASVLYGLGVTKGERVATLLPKTPELLITTLALWRLGAVYVPLFTAFGPQAIAYRMANSAARVVVTDPTNRAKIDQARGLLGTQSASLARIVTVEGPGGDRCVPGDIPFWAALEAAVPVGTPVASTAEDVLILIYTSGTTGEPKGVEVPVKALASIEAYMRFGLELRDDDVFWNMADPGWAYGLYCGLVGALLL